MLTSFRDVISLWESLSALSAETGAPIENVRKWKQRDRIPDDWWFAVLMAAFRRGLRLRAWDLVLIAAGEATGAPEPQVQHVAAE